MTTLMSHYVNDKFEGSWMLECETWNNTQNWAIERLRSDNLILMWMSAEDVAQ